MKYAKQTTDIGISFLRLDLKSLHTFSYSEVSFNNRRQIGYYILLMGHQHNCCITEFSSHITRRRSRSSLIGETMARDDSFNKSFALKYDMQTLDGAFYAH